MNEAQRQQAWARVHQPNVSTAELNYLAGLYPEFLPAISTHPNFVAAQPQPASGATTGATPTAIAATTAGAAQAVGATQAAGAPISPSNTRINVLAVCALIVATLGALFYFFIPFVIDVLFSTDNYAAIDLALNAPFVCISIVAAVLAVLALRASLPARGRWAAVAALGASGFQLLAILAQTIGSAIFDALYYF